MEGGSSRPLLCRFTSLLLLLQLPMWGSAEEFLVIGPTDPIVAVLGGDTTLPCFLSPAMSAENMELRWFRSKFSEAVFIYQNQQEQKEEQMPQYAGRVLLVRDFLTQGQAAVRIHKVQVSDDGLYTCFFKKGGSYEEATLVVKVAGVGSAPQVHIEGPGEDGVRVVCMASGWFPKPQVQWKDLTGEKFLAFSEAHAQDADGLFHVEASLVVRDSSVGNVTCSILNPILGQEKTKAIFIPEPFFPQASPWKPAFAMSLTVLGLLILGAGYFLKKEHSAKVQAQQEQENLRLHKEEDRLTKQEALKARVELQAELDWRKKVYQAAWRKAQLYADWRKEQFQICSVTLNPRSAHPNLSISQEKTSVTWKDICEKQNDDRCSVLGLKGISSGRCYWEVETSYEDKSEWAVGVCREDVDRNDWFRECPDKGFWVVGWFEEGYCACTTPQTRLSLRQAPCRMGIFLDYDGGDISFYNMTDGSHIFSFSEASFSGTLFPYFMFKSGDISLTICSTVGGPKGLPVPFNKAPSTLNEPVSPSGEGLSSASGGDGVLPGPESPLLPQGSKAVPP
ncbi:butyrophilin subfamily 1 member A1-like [Elephas maximus indicus]|uniref:butyrophilin subfamily 1 member A1-like n=1 Tax=Elephas maximus indicus TaxID=99487 RepID=UPI002116639B|nr:butyrophilin subfamily 1 member A1-like [Elephas maximus indicus]XP_049745560.1 butyrophilin subfamily 1 member A1-like [Elephas maximus indicus]